MYSDGFFNLFEIKYMYIKIWNKIKKKEEKEKLKYKVLYIYIYNKLRVKREDVCVILIAEKIINTIFIQSRRHFF